MRKLPVIIINGFYGAGKSSLLTHILQNKGGLKVAVIINEANKVNIDAELLRNSILLSRIDDTLIEMSSGCICRELRGGLIKSVKTLAYENRFDYLLIESSGISEPLPLAQALCYPSDEHKIDLTGLCYIDTSVTVIDAYNFLKDYCSKELLKVISPQVVKDDNPAAVALLKAQIGFANVVVINKAGMVPPSQLSLMKAMIRNMNAEAIILEANYGRVDLRYLLNTGLFDLNRITQSEDWIEHLSTEKYLSSKQEYGLSSFVYRSRIPFHAERLFKYVNIGWPDNIIRIKGIFWLNSDPEKVFIWNQSGGIFSTEKVGIWWCTMPLDKRVRYDAYLNNQKQIEKDWDKEFGDRHIEIVITGQNLQKEFITGQLDACLCTVTELENMEWKSGFPFPFDGIKKNQLN